MVFVKSAYFESMSRKTEGPRGERTYSRYMYSVLAAQPGPNGWLSCLHTYETIIYLKWNDLICGTFWCRGWVPKFATGLIQSNLAIRNFLVILKLFFNAKCFLFIWSKWQIGHRKWFLNTNKFLIKTFLITKFDYTAFLLFEIQINFCLLTRQKKVTFRT